MKTRIASFLRSSSSFVSLSLAASLAASGCTIGNIGTDSNGPASFTGELVTTPLAAGATTTMTVGDTNTQTPVNSVTSSDPSIVTVGPLQGSTATSNQFSVTGGVPGTATLTAFDVSGKTLVTLSVQVAPTTTIKLDDTGPLNVLTGQTFSEHSTTIGSGGVVLVGDGAIHYAYTGALAAGQNNGCSGDCAFFQAASPGDGQVQFTASSSSATASLAVHAVDPSQVDSVSLASKSVALSLASDGSSGAPVAYTLTAAGTVVHGTGLQCVSSNTNVATAYVDLFGPPVTGATSGSIAIIANATGATTISCTFGTQQVSLTATVQ